MLFSTLLGFSITASVLGTAVDLRDLHEDSRSRFTRAHSLGDNYVFNSRDGWTSLNVTDMQYKYSPVSTGRQNLNDNSLDRRSSHKNKSDSKKKKTIKAKVPPKGKALFSTNSFLGDAVKDPLHSLGSAFHAIGDAVEAVIITWYTGHDLENPSCWSDSVWTPTDASFVAALTLEGWTNKPQCFKFLELCHGSKACVFVRVVDTCAGCAAGSQHVDLTRAAFGALASFDVGILNVQMRPASDPSGTWHEDLWGPKHHDH